MATAKTFEEIVIAKLEEILANQQVILDRLDEVDEGLANVSTPGGNYSIDVID
jgi:hypothetical protein